MDLFDFVLRFFPPRVDSSVSKRDGALAAGCSFPNSDEVDSSVSKRDGALAAGCSFPNSDEVDSSCSRSDLLADSS